LERKLAKANETIVDHNKETKKMMQQMQDYFQKMMSIDVDE